MSTIGPRGRHERLTPDSESREIAGRLCVGQRRHAEERGLEGKDGFHRRLQGSRGRPAPRPKAQRRGRRSGRSRRARRGTASSVRLPARLVSVLGTRARPKRLRPRTVRRELHRGRTRRCRGVRRRSLPDRRCRLRGHATPGHVLPRRDPDERPEYPRAARLPPPPGLLLPRARRRRRPSRETRSSSSPQAPNRCPSPRSTRCSTSPATRASNCSGRCESPRSAPAGRPRSELCSRKNPAAATPVSRRQAPHPPGRASVR